MRHEVFTKLPRIEIGQAGRREERPPRHRHGVQIEVGGENLHAVLIELVAQMFGEQDGDGVRLLAGGAAGHPDPDFLAGLLVGDDAAHHGGQAGESLLVAEEGGDRDQDILGQLFQFFGALRDQLQVFIQIDDVVGRHPPADPAPERGFLVAAEVDPGMLANLGQQFLEGGRFGFRFLLQRHGALSAGDEGDFLADALRGQNPVDAAGIDRRLRHAVVFGGGGFLGEGEAAGGLDGVDAGRAIRTRSGQYDPDGRVAHLRRQGGKEPIDGRFGQRFLGGFDQPEAAVLNQQIPVGWGDIDRVGRRLAVILDILDGH